MGDHKLFPACNHCLTVSTKTAIRNPNIQPSVHSPKFASNSSIHFADTLNFVSKQILHPPKISFPNTITVPLSTQSNQIISLSVL